MSDENVQTEEPEEVYDPSSVEDEDVDTAVRYTISSYGADYPVDGLVKRLQAEDVYIPDFQRGYVWSHPREPSLI